MSKKILFLFIIILICNISIGCDKYDVIDENSNNFPPINPLPDDKLELILYYPNSSMEYLVPEFRAVPKKSEDVEIIVINELLKGTKGRNLVNIIPPNAKAQTLYVTDKIAYVSFSRDLIYNNYTEKEEALIIYSIVNTLTSLPNIEEVQILIDGKAEDVLCKHYSIKEPLNFSHMIVTKDYISPISIVNEYYSSIIEEDYDKAMSMLDFEDVEKIRYNTLKAYIVDAFKGTNKYVIKNYIINKYEDELNINLFVIFTYEKNNTKYSNKTINLKYDGNNFLIKALGN